MLLLSKGWRTSQFLMHCEQMISNVGGMAIGAAATIVTALYQSWAGSKQKELRASSMQLLLAYTPQATLMLGILVPLCEPVSDRQPSDLILSRVAGLVAHLLPTSSPCRCQVGWSTSSRTEHTLLGYHYTWAAIFAIAISAALGLLVSLSTFLVIGATSSLTYNVVRKDAEKRGRNL